MGEPTHRLTDEEQKFMIALMVAAKPEHLEGFVLVAVTDERGNCGHKHIRVTRGGGLTRAQELDALRQAVDMLYE